MKKVIAIDGPSGAGKSTVAKLVAKELGFSYLDTGALYRGVALALLNARLDEDASDDAISEVLSKTRIAFRKGHVFLNDQDVSQEIRSPEAGHFASVFSARKPVRRHLLDTQRNAALDADLVAEGRDMTTVVFPQACVKIYLDASVEERARRRTLELLTKGFVVDEERIRMDITERDVRDSNRDIAPLRKADDAFLVDSSGMPAEEVFRKIMELISPAAGRNDAT